MATINPPSPQRRTSDAWRIAAACGWVLMQGLGLVGFIEGQAQAQSVYRCGSSYSHDAECKQGAATPVPLQGEAPQASKAQTGLAQQMQNEAERLENLRQREMRAIEKQQGKPVNPPLARHAVKKPQAATQSAAQQTSNDLPNQHKTKKRKKSTTASPYFTAKGATDSKKP